MTTDPIPLAQALVRCRSVTPADDGALDLVQRALEPLGFACTRLVFGPDDYRVDNLFARRGTDAPHFCYAGHTDVVPTGNSETGRTTRSPARCARATCTAAAPAT